MRKVGYNWTKNERKVGYNKETRKIEKKKMDSRGGRAVGMCCCQRKEREKNEWLRP
jgi:hypothetical protein